MNELKQAGYTAEKAGQKRAPCLSKEFNAAVDAGVSVKDAATAWLNGWDDARDEKIAAFQY
jgi:ribosome modulation factor